MKETRDHCETRSSQRGSKTKSGREVIELALFGIKGWNENIRRCGIRMPVGTTIGSRSGIGVAGSLVVV